MFNEYISRNIVQARKPILYVTSECNSRYIQATGSFSWIFSCTEEFSICCDFHLVHVTEYFLEEYTGKFTGFLKLHFNPIDNLTSSVYVTYL
jgi:hypothetical protein